MVAREKQMTSEEDKYVSMTKNVHSPTGMAVTVVTAPVVARDNIGGPWQEGMATAAAGTEI